MGNHRRRWRSIESQVTRLTASLVIGVAYLLWRVLPALQPSIAPTPAVAVPFDGIAKAASSMTAADRSAMHEAYLILSRAVAADPSTDPTFTDTAAVRRAHRAALLVVWKGVLANKTGEVPGLREALESALNSRIGTADIPLNPALKADTAKALGDMAASFK